MLDGWMSAYLSKNKETARFAAENSGDRRFFFSLCRQDGVAESTSSRQRSPNHFRFDVGNRQRSEENGRRAAE